MRARLFSRIHQSIQGVPKILIFSLVFFVSVILIVTPTYAGNEYDNYKFLFKSPSAGSDAGAQIITPGKEPAKASGIVYERPTEQTGAGVRNFRFGLSLVINNATPQAGFAGYQKKAEWFWDRVTTDDSEGFVLRVCDVSANPSGTPNDATYEEKNCWIKKLPYEKKADVEVGTQSTLGKIIGEANFYTSSFAGREGTERRTFNKDISGWQSNQKLVGLDTKNINTWYTYDNRDADPSKRTATEKKSVFFPGGSRIQADLWYCAGPASDPTDNGEQAYKNTLPKDSDPGIRQFGSLCGDTSYFRIGNPIFFSIPATESAIKNEVENGASAESGAGAATGAQFSATQDKPTKSNLPECGISGSGIVGCLARLVYFLIYQPLAWLAGFFGKLFDFFIGYSLNDESYRFAFVVTGWKIVRDICNIFFIIMLVWTGFATVFGFSKISMKQAIPSIIINAIIINFSLFGTRLAIDLSNIVARVFYGQIKVCAVENCGTDSNGEVTYKTNGVGGYTPISEAIVSSFNPQRVFDSNKLLPQTAGSGAENDVNFSATNNNSTSVASRNNLSPGEYAGYFIIVSLFAAAIMFVIMKMFWTMAFLFLGRVVGLYVSMMFSPFAFLTRGSVPLVGNIETLKWSHWLRDLTSYTMMAPIFVFFLYIVYSFMQKQSEFVNVAGISQTTGNFLEGVLYICIPMGIIYLLIEYGVTITKKYSGTIGDMIQKKVDSFVGGVGGVIGGAAGLATGGAALLGTRLGSRVGKAVGKSSLGQWAASNTDNSKFARFMNKQLNNTQTGSWDLRKTALFKQTEKGMAAGGIKTQDKVTGALAGLGKTVGAGNLVDFTEDRFKGGFKAQQKARQAEIKKNIEDRVTYEYLSDGEAKKIWDRKREKKAGEEALKEYAKDKDIEYKTANDLAAAKKKELEANKKEIEKTEEKLLVRQDTMSDTEKIATQAALAALKTSRETLQSEHDTAANTRDTRLQAVKNNNDYRNDADYQKKLNGAPAILATDTTPGVDKVVGTRETQAIKDKETYGIVDNVKTLTSAMRREYAEDMRNNSFWMKDGKQRKWLWTLGGSYGAGIGGALGAAIGGAMTALSTSFGAVLGERIKFEQEALDAATSSYVKDYGKMKGKVKSEQLSDKIKEIDDRIDNYVAEMLQIKSGAARADYATKKEEAKGKKAQEKRDALEELALVYKDDLDAAKAAYNTANIAWRTAAPGAAKDAAAEVRRNAALAQKKAADKLKDVNSAFKQRDTNQEKADKMKSDEEAKAAAKAAAAK